SSAVPFPISWALRQIALTRPILARDACGSEEMRSDSVSTLVDLDRPTRDPEVNSFADVLIRDRVVILGPHDVPVAGDSALVDPLADLVRYLRQRPQQRPFFRFEHARPGT